MNPAAESAGVEETWLKHGWKGQVVWMRLSEINGFCRLFASRAISARTAHRCENFWCHAAANFTCLYISVGQVFLYNADLERRVRAIKLSNAFNIPNNQITLPPFPLKEIHRQRVTPSTLTEDAQPISSVLSSFQHKLHRYSSGLSLWTPTKAPRIQPTLRSKHSNKSSFPVTIIIIYST